MTQMKSLGQIALPKGTIPRRVTDTDRRISPEEMLMATGRRLFVDKEVLAEMPRGEGADKEVFFIPLKGGMRNKEVEKLLSSLGMEDCDLYTFARANVVDPALAPNGIHWEDPDGNWVFAAFTRWGVSVRRYKGFWGGGWYRACVRKANPRTL